jgi:hypothetical protein
MVEWRLAIVELSCGVADRHGVGEQDGAAAALRAKVVDIGGQTVADIDHGVDGG